MANDFSDIEDAMITVLTGDATLVALLGKFTETSGATLNEALDDSETEVDYTGTAPALQAIWLIDDEKMLVTALTGGGSPATVTRGYLGTTAATHTTATTINKITPAIEIEPRQDLWAYTSGQLPVVALSCNNADKDSEENETIGSFDTRYLLYIEVISQGMDIKTVTRAVKAIMSRIRRLVRIEDNKSAPLGGAVERIFIGDSTLRRSVDKGKTVAWMYTAAECVVIVTDTDL